MGALGLFAGASPMAYRPCRMTRSRTTLPTAIPTKLHGFLVSCLLIASATCRAKDDAPPESETPASTPGLGMPPLAGFFADKLAQPGPFEAPRQSADFAADAPHLLVLELDRPIGE